MVSYYTVLLLLPWGGFSQQIGVNSRFEDRKYETELWNDECQTTHRNLFYTCRAKLRVLNTRVIKLF